jgi:outer membrane immunogenic protein
MWTGFYAGLNAGYGFGTNSNVQTIAIGQDKPVFGGWKYDNTLIVCEAQFAQGCGASPIMLALPTGAGLAQTGSFANKQSGFIGGGQVGYNYQWGPNFVIGIEADMQGTGIRGRSNGIGNGWGSVSIPYLTQPFSDSVGSSNNSWNANSAGVTSVNAGVDWLGTVRGRMGYLFTPTMLLYATGGLTYGGVYANVNQASLTGIGPNLPQRESAGLIGGMMINPFSSVNYTFVGGGNKSQTLVGWNVGGGIEWMFMPNWSLKAEGIYWNMGNMTLPTATVAVAPDSNHIPLVTYGAARVNYQGVIARAGINYHFNWFAPAPVVASY